MQRDRGERQGTKEMTYQLLQGDSREVLRTLPEKSVHTIVTSPPYFGLRDYGVDGQIGLEATPSAYVAELVAVFRECWRVLRDDGTLWLNLGDSYAGYWGDKKAREAGHRSSADTNGWTNGFNMNARPSFHDAFDGTGIKPKDLIGIPWRVAFALQADGWYVRSDIIWHKCLSGGTWIYVKSQKGVMPMMIKDMVRLSNVQLWDGEKWVKVVSWSKNERAGKEIELVLRSGERISCTPEHRFPTANGLKEAKDLDIGDKLQSTVFPDEGKTPAYLTDDALWLVGLYIAEGSRSQDCIQIAGHIKEEERWERVQRLCAHYGARCTRSITGNKMDIRVYGKVISAIIDQHVSGSNAKDKGLTTACWQYDNATLNFILHGYLSGDGHFDSQNNRYRLGFTRNYNLERDLRLICARLGYSITLNMSTVAYNGVQSPTFRGEIRMIKSDHWNAKDRNEIVEIRNARCRYTYDIAVDSEPHLFALASGILTHNSNPMPESVTDRPTKAHEYIFLLTKSQRYYYDADAIAEKGGAGKPCGKKNDASRNDLDRTGIVRGDGLTRNRRSVWTVATQPYAGAHFATFPPALIEPCILAGTSEHGVCANCGAPWERVVEKEWVKHPNGLGNGTITKDLQTHRRGTTSAFATGGSNVSQTLGFAPTCTCNAGIVPATVLDPFNGSGTTGAVACAHGRAYIGIDLNADYIALAHDRIREAIRESGRAYAQPICKAADFADLPMFAEA